MSEDSETYHETSAKVGAEVSRDNSEKDSETCECGNPSTHDYEEPSKVSEEKLRQAQLVDELQEEVSIKKKLPKRKKPEAQIPITGKLGKKFTVKLNKRYDVVNLKVYQGEKIEENAGNTNIVHDKDEKKTDKISYDFFDPVPLKGITKNGLVKGKYLVKVHAYGQEDGDELEQEQIVDVK